MTVEALIISLVIGAVGGWLASKAMKRGAFGPGGDVVLGIVGALVAGWLLPQYGIMIGDGILGLVFNAFIGACIVLLVLRPLIRSA